MQSCRTIHSILKGTAKKPSRGKRYFLLSRIFTLWQIGKRGEVNQQTFICWHIRLWLPLVHQPSDSILYIASSTLNPFTYLAINLLFFNCLYERQWNHRWFWLESPLPYPADPLGRSRDKWLGYDLSPFQAYHRWHIMWPVVDISVVWAACTSSTRRSLLSFLMPCLCACNELRQSVLSCPMSASNTKTGVLCRTLDSESLSITRNYYYPFPWGMKYQLQHMLPLKSDIWMFDGILPGQ